MTFWRARSLDAASRRSRERRDRVESLVVSHSNPISSDPRRRGSGYLFGYSPKGVADMGVVSVASHISRLNRSFRGGSGMFQRKKGGKKNGKTPVG